jgi:hypothetical protein
MIFRPWTDHIKSAIANSIITARWRWLRATTRFRRFNKLAATSIHPSLPKQSIYYSNEALLASSNSTRMDP